MPDLVRSVTLPRVCRTLLVVALATSLAATAYAIGRLEPAPIAITTPPIIVPAPNVTVTPAPVTVTPAPAPIAPPPVESAPQAVPQPRALTPKVDAACVIQGDAVEPIPTCAWDDGFPAIARDGSLIAVKHAPGAGPSDLYSLTIRFVDPMTSRTVRDAVIITETEASAFVYPDEDTDKAAKIQNAIRIKIARRVAAVQKSLDTTKFRSLRVLGEWHQNQEAEQPVAPPTDHIYGEIAGSAVRIVDPKSASVVWRGDFSVAGPKVDDAMDSCGGWGLWAMSAWWDPESQVVLARSTHRTGGCMCPDIDSWSAKRF